MTGPTKRTAVPYAEVVAKRERLGPEAFDIQGWMQRCFLSRQ